MAHLSMAAKCSHKWQCPRCPAADDEARTIWLRFLPPARVLPYGNKENFWEMGDQVGRAVQTVTSGNTDCYFRLEGMQSCRRRSSQISHFTGRTRQRKEMQCCCNGVC
jgi:hypothetical protein